MTMTLSQHAEVAMANFSQTKAAVILAGDPEERDLVPMMEWWTTASDDDQEKLVISLLPNLGPGQIGMAVEFLAKVLREESGLATTVVVCAEAWFNTMPVDTKEEDLPQVGELQRRRLAGDAEVKECLQVMAASRDGEAVCLSRPFVVQGKHVIFEDVHSMNDARGEMASAVISAARAA